MWNAYVHAPAIAVGAELDVDTSFDEDAVPCVGDQLKVTYDTGASAPARIRLARHDETIIDVDPEDGQKRQRWLLRRAEWAEPKDLAVWIVIEGGD